MKLPFDLRYPLLGLLAYVIFLVLQFPAERAYAHWQASEYASREIALTSIRGSVWSGHAEMVVFKGQRLEALEWRLRPWALLIGQVALGWRFRLPGDEGYGQGVTALGLGGSIAFKDLEARFPASLAASLGRLQALRPAGTVNLNLQGLHWDGQSLAATRGRVVWQEAEIKLLKPLELGDLALTLETTSEDVVKGVLSDAGGPLVAEGLLMLADDGGYQFSGSFGAREGADDLEQALRSLGRPGADGRVQVKHTGRLAALGFGS
jgi:hypothetical protein